jgi:hypothetical protein
MRAFLSWQANRCVLVDAVVMCAPIVIMSYLGLHFGWLAGWAVMSIFWSTHLADPSNQRGL